MVYHHYDTFEAAAILGTAALSMAGTIMLGPYKHVNYQKPKGVLHAEEANIYSDKADR